MKRWIIGTIFLTWASGAIAELVVPVKTIRANNVIAASDLTTAQGHHDNAFSGLEEVVGQEARRTLYAGRPILVDDIGPPALVQRNQIVSLEFVSGGLTILTEGRSLERGGIGDSVRIMNLSSRATLFGQVLANGRVQVLR